LANANGAVTLAKSYQPYGSVLSSAGTGTSMYGFTGEQTDATNLIFLRARYYGSGQGRFVTRDTWPGDVEQPISYGAWLYGYDNPINNTDPSGMLSNEQIARGFGYGPDEFSKVVDWFTVNAPNHWALLAALQDAENINVFGVGVDNWEVYDGWRVAESFDKSTAYLIDFGSGHTNYTLKNFARFITKTSTNGIAGSRNTSYLDHINMYFVNHKGYKAYDRSRNWGWNRTPDVKLLPGSALIGLATSGVIPSLPTGGRVGIISPAVNVILDRYGRYWLTGDIAFGLQVTIVSVYEGWISKNGSTTIPSEQQISRALEFTSGTVSGIAFYTKAGTEAGEYGIDWEGWAAGIGVTCSISFTLPWPIWTDSNASWDWVDRAHTYTSQDIRP